MPHLPHTRWTIYLNGWYTIRFQRSNWAFFVAFSSAVGAGKWTLYFVTREQIEGCIKPSIIIHERASINSVLLHCCMKTQYTKFQQIPICNSSVHHTNGLVNDMLMRTFIASCLNVSFVMVTGISPSHRVSKERVEVRYCGQECAPRPLGSKLLIKWIR